MFCSECGNYAANKALRKLGVKDESKVFTFDGNADGKVTYQDVYVKISNDTPNLKDVTKIFAELPDGNVELTPDTWIVFNGDNGVSSIEVDDIAMISIVSDAAISEPGLYVFFGDEITISRIETESIKPIDQKYLPDNTLDLTKFTCKVNETEQTFNDAIMALFQQSMQNGGTMGMVDFTDESRQLSKAASSCNHPALMVKLGDDFVKYPTVYAFVDYDAGQLAANGMTVTGYGPVDAACIIQFGSSGTSGRIYVSAKVLT